MSERVLLEEKTTKKDKTLCKQSLCAFICCYKILRPAYFAGVKPPAGLVPQRKRMEVSPVQRSWYLINKAPWRCIATALLYVLMKAWCFQSNEGPVLVTPQDKERPQANNQNTLTELLELWHYPNRLLSSSSFHRTAHYLPTSSSRLGIQLVSADYSSWSI
jgi:hypothetical protein